MIKGIYVEIKVGPVGYAPSNDPMYIGIYGKNGGREFALDAENYEEFDSPNKIVKLQIGDFCCEKDGVLQVRHSDPAGGSNTPINYPLELEDIEYVYLRKYQRALEVDKNAVLHDDLLELAYAKVLLCDTNGDVRLFEKNQKMFFAYESGLQHWLEEGQKPGCLVNIQLDSVHYGGQNIGRYRIEYNLLANVDNLIGQEIYEIGQHRFRNGTTEYPSTIKSFFFPGCCGSEIPIKLHAFVVDKDIGSHPDGDTDEEFEVTCLKEKQTTPFSIDVEVTDHRAIFFKRTAIFTFKGVISTHCVGVD